MSGVFEALGEPARRHILELLSVGERSVGEVVTELQSLTPMSQPAVSQHLKVLREAGLVAVRADGARRMYSLDEGGLGAARAWLARLSDPLEALSQSLDALATEVARGRRARRRSSEERESRPGEGEARPA